MIPKSTPKELSCLKAAHTWTDPLSGIQTSTQNSWRGHFIGPEGPLLTDTPWLVSKGKGPHIPRDKLSKSPPHRFWREALRWTAKPCRVTGSQLPRDAREERGLHRVGSSTERSGQSYLAAWSPVSCQTENQKPSKKPQRSLHALSRYKHGLPVLIGHWQSGDQTKTYHLTRIKHQPAECHLSNKGFAYPALPRR